MFRCSGGFAIVRKSEPFAVCIPSDFAVHVAQAFKRKEDVNTAIKECLGNQGADGRYLCALWDVTEDDKQDLPAEENFVDGGDRGKLLGENWLTYKLFLQWDPSLHWLLLEFMATCGLPCTTMSAIRSERSASTEISRSELAWDRF